MEGKEEQNAVEQATAEQTLINTLVLFKIMDRRKLEIQQKGLIR